MYTTGLENFSSYKKRLKSRINGGLEIEEEFVNDVNHRLMDRLKKAEMLHFVLKLSKRQEAHPGDVPRTSHNRISLLIQAIINRTSDDENVLLI